MDIAPYIRELLTERDQVSVPGFGLFMKRRLQGYFDQQTGKLYPPAERLELLVNSDATDELAHFISEKKQISTTSAEYFINQFVEQIQSRLLQGHVSLTGIGTVSLQNKAFLLSDTAPLPASAFGLPVLTEPMITLSGKKQVQKPQPQVIQAADFAEEKRRSVPSYVYWLLTVVIVLLSAGIVYYYHPEWFPFPNGQQNEAVKKAAQPVAEPAMPADTPAKDTADASGMADSVAATPAQKPAEIPAKMSTSETGSDSVQHTPRAYEIIGASFKTLTAARKQVKRFAWKGVQAKILKNEPGKRIKISLGSFNDAASAQTELKRLKTELNNKELFIEPYKTK